MNTFLQLDEERKKAAYSQTSAQLNIPESYVEKDLWVCWVLQELFANPALAPHLTFRGGTSLSKAFGIIERFSEDIDISVSREWLGITAETDPANAATPSQRDKRKKDLRKLAREKMKTFICPLLQESLQVLALDPETWSLELNDEENDLESARDPYCIFLNYPCLTGSPMTDYIRSRVKIEFSARAEGCPDKEATVTSFVAEQFPDAFQEPQFKVKALSPTRTFWEKCFIIHEENTAPEERRQKPRLARHYYDLYFLLEKGEIDLELSLFNEVKKHREIYFRQTWVDYESITPEQLKIGPSRDMLTHWEEDYTLMKSMFYGDYPSLEEAMTSITSSLTTVL